MLRYHASEQTSVAEPRPSIAATRESTQMRTFKNWLNYHLRCRNLVVKDIAEDLRSGVALIHLVEVLFPNVRIRRFWQNPSLDIQRLENLTLVINSLREQGVKLENVGAKDILDGNLKLILGLTWVTIRRVQLETIAADLSKAALGSVTPVNTALTTGVVVPATPAAAGEVPSTSGPPTAEDALLTWARKTTKGYKGVDLGNLHPSQFQDGLALAALVDSKTRTHTAQGARSAIDVDKLGEKTPLEIIQQAFSQAEEQLGVPQLLDARAVVEGKIDHDSVVTWLSSLYHGNPQEAAKHRAAEEPDALMVWAQKMTETYQGCQLADLHPDRFRDGMALCALVDSQTRMFAESGAICSYDYGTLDKSRPVENMNMALDQAERELGVPQTLDAYKVAKGTADPDTLVHYLEALYKGHSSQGKDKGKKKRKEEEEDAALHWARSITGVDLRSAHPSEFKDGKALCALVDNQIRSFEAQGAKCSVDFDALDYKNPEECMKMAMELAWRELGVPITLDPAKVAQGVASRADIASYVKTLKQGSVESSDARVLLEALRVRKSEKEKQQAEGELQRREHERQKLEKQCGGDGPEPESQSQSLDNLRKEEEALRNKVALLTKLLEEQKESKAASSRGPGGTARYRQVFRKLLEKERDERRRRYSLDQSSQAASVLPSWIRHTEIVHGEWRGESAGGSFAQATFRNNPQWELKVATTTHVHISLRQEEDADPVALFLVQSCSPFGVHVPFKKSDLVQSVGYVKRTEVSLDVVLEPQSKPYILLAALEETNIEKKFNITMYSDHTVMNRRSTPPPSHKKMVFHGDWKGATAGGMHDLPTWRFNPQYRVEATNSPVNLHIILSQGFSVNSICPPISLNVVRNEVGRHDAHVTANHTVVAEVGTDFNTEDFHGKIAYIENQPEVVLDTTLPASQRPHFIVPSTWEAGTEATYMLTIYSDTDVTIKPARMIRSFEHHVTIKGRWKEESSGGAYGSATWRNNPQYRVEVSKPTNISVVLSRSEVVMKRVGRVVYVDKKHTPLSIHIARNRDRKAVDELLPDHDIVEEIGTYLENAEVVLDALLKHTLSPYFIVPSTYLPKTEMPYGLSLYADNPINVVEVVHQLVCPASPTAGVASRVRSDTSRVMLSAAWKGPTAGGQRAMPTWFRNPQFLLTPLESGTVTALLRQNPENLLMVNMVVAQNKDSSFTSCLTPEYAIVAETCKGDANFLKAPEVSVTFDVEANENYFIVCSTLEAWMESEFSVSILGRLEKVGFQRVVSSVIGMTQEFSGEWKGWRAGGRPSQPTYRNNPQYRVTAAQPTTMYISVGQGSWRTPKPLGCAVVRNESMLFNDHEVLPGYTVVTETRSDAATHFKKPRVWCKVPLTDIRRPCFIVPSLWNAADEDLFVLTATTLHPVNIEHVTLMKPNAVQGRWQGECAGGAPKYDSWLKNPQFRLLVRQAAYVMIILTQHATKDPKPLGLHIVRNRYTRDFGKVSPHFEVVGQTKVKEKYTYFTQAETFVEIRLEGQEDPYFVVPSLHDPGMEGGFTLSLLGDPTLQLEPLPSGDGGGSSS